MQTGMVDLENVQYAGFWARFLAFLLDSLVQGLLLVPVLLLVFGPGILYDRELMSSPLGYAVNYGLPLLFVVLCWKYKSATPGKYMMGMSIVDARTGGHPPTGRLVLRYLGYYVSVLTCFLGFAWIAFDKRKQGLHDKIADTLVILNPPKPGNDAA